MRKKCFCGLSLILSLILVSIAVFAQDNGEIGIVGPMSGRVTNANGDGISGATISVYSAGACFDWNGTSVKSNPFGYYSLRVHYDCALIVTVTKKGMEFTPNSMVLPIDGNYENIDFLGTVGLSNK